MQRTYPPKATRLVSESQLDCDPGLPGPDIWTRGAALVPGKSSPHFPSQRPASVASLVNGGACPGLRPRETFSFSLEPPCHAGTGAAGDQRAGSPKTQKRGDELPSQPC